jgi:hypothetical protein
VDIFMSNTVVKCPNEFSYSYKIRNDKSSKQKLVEFFIEYESPVCSLSAPSGWLGLISNVRKKVVMWSSNDSIYDVLPGNEVSDFSFRTTGLPAIVTFYARGFVEEPSFPEGDAPPIELTSGLDIFENSKQGHTIGPKLTPSPFIATIWCDTLFSYTRQSVNLGWLKSTRDHHCDKDEKPENGISKNIERRILIAKRELSKKDTIRARRELEQLLKKVERIYKSSEGAAKGHAEHNDKHSDIVMTSEAYALLKYNTEYLIDQIK